MKTSFNKIASRRLDGGLRLTKEQRINAKIPRGLLISRFKYWVNIKHIVDRYFNLVGENYYHTPEDFSLELYTALVNVCSKLNEPEKEDPNFPLFDYCKKMIQYYLSDKVDNEINKYYQEKLAKRDRNAAHKEGFFYRHLNTIRKSKRN